MRKVYKSESRGSFNCIVFTKKDRIPRCREIEQFRPLLKFTNPFTIMKTFQLLSSIFFTFMDYLGSFSTSCEIAKIVNFTTFAAGQVFPMHINPDLVWFNQRKLQSFIADFVTKNNSISSLNFCGLRFLTCAQQKKLDIVSKVKNAFIWSIFELNGGILKHDWTQFLN